MRWVLRAVATLVLAPPLYRLIFIYLASQQGDEAGDLLQASVEALLQYYTAFSVPALALIILILTPAELLLKRSGLLLMTVVVSPLIAWPTALVFAHFIQDAQAKGTTGLVAIAVTYGLVWGLSIRETKPRERVKVAQDVREARPAVDTTEKVGAVVASNLDDAEPEPEMLAPEPTVRPEPQRVGHARSKSIGRETIEFKTIDHETIGHAPVRPGTSADKIGAIVAGNLRGAPSDPAPGESRLVGPGDTGTSGPASTTEKVAAVVAGNWAPADAKTAKSPPAATTTATTGKVADILAGNRKQAGASATATKTRPAATVADKVADVVAANWKEAGTGKTSAEPRPAETARAEAVDARTAREKIADYWNRIGGDAKSGAAEGGGTDDKAAAYWKRAEVGETPSERKPATTADPKGTRESETTPDLATTDKIADVVAGNWARAAATAPEPAREPPAPPSTAPAPAEPGVENAPAPKLPQEKRMPRNAPGFELDQRNPLVDRSEAEKRGPR